MHSEYLIRREFESSLLPKWRQKFKVEGHSYTAGRTLKFLVNHMQKNSEGAPNWRESLVCPISKLNNRMRASVHIFDAECSPYKHSRIYISEQATALFKFFSVRYPNITGSEFLGENLASGSVTPSGIRHEDLTNLTFADQLFDNLLTFDCFEHIPNYSKALHECYRVLTPGGNLLFSVPFYFNSKINITRAKLSPEGSIVHIMEPEYHGNPVNKNGCLCYRYFGWEILDELRETGFRDAYAILYWSKEFGYLGNEQVVFFARK